MEYEWMRTRHGTVPILSPSMRTSSDFILSVSTRNNVTENMCARKWLTAGSQWYFTKRKILNNSFLLLKLQNLKDHLKVAEKDIANAIPDVTFSGIAVIDYEHWRPVFSHNWGPRAVYKTETIKIVRQKYPQLTFEECQQLAEKLWNTHAK